MSTPELTATIVATETVTLTTPPTIGWVGFFYGEWERCRSLGVGEAGEGAERDQKKKKKKRCS